MDLNEDGIPEVDMAEMVTWIRARVAVTNGIALSEEAVIAVLEAENAFLFEEKEVDGGE